MSDLKSKSHLHHSTRVYSPWLVGRATHRHAEVGRFHHYRGVLLLALMVLVIWLNIYFIKPLVMGAIFATVLYPFKAKIKTDRFGEMTKAALVTSGFAIAFLVPIGIFVILGVDKALEQAQVLQNFNFTAGQAQSSTMLDTFGLKPVIARLTELAPISEAQVRLFVTRAVVSLASTLGGMLQTFLTDLPGVIFSNIVILFTIFFLLIDGQRAIGFIRQNSIFGLKQTNRILNAARDICHSVMASNLAAGAIQSLLVGFACLINGRSEDVLFIMFATFIASFFPVIGVLPVTIFLTVHAFVDGHTTAGFVFLAFVFLVPIAENIVRPYVLKDGAQLHPLIAFVAAFGAFDVIGFYGLFIGPVIAGLFFALLPMITRTYPSSPKSV